MYIKRSKSQVLNNNSLNIILYKFTLIELMIVVAIIGILASMLLPSLQRARREAIYSLCLSNLRQNGLAVTSYSDDNSSLFPYNGNAVADWSPAPGRHVSWNSTIVQQAWLDYGQGLSEDSIQSYNSTLYCPTQEYHRAVTLSNPNAYIPAGLIGYFYLPHRSTTSANYSIGESEWVTRDRLGVSDGPIMMDMKQSYNNEWDDVYFSSGFAQSSHPNRGGETYGGNFLFEDGRAKRYYSVNVGATAGGFSFWYDIEID